MQDLEREHRLPFFLHAEHAHVSYEIPENEKIPGLPGPGMD